MLGRARRWRALTGHDDLAGIVFDTVQGASIAHLPLRDPVTQRLVPIEDAATRARPVNAAAIAQSLAIPYTTVRRRIAELAATGQLVREAGGFRVSPAFLADRVAYHAMAETARALAGTLTALAEADYLPAIRAIAGGVTALPAGVVERPLKIYALRTMETLTQLYGDVPRATIMGTITAANVQHITADPELARRYADDASVPPDGERRPIPLRALARAVEMPFETVRRRVAALVREGLVERHDGGVIVPTRNIVATRHAADNRRRVGMFEQMLDVLVMVADRAAPPAA